MITTVPTHLVVPILQQQTSRNHLNYENCCKKQAVWTKLFNSNSIFQDEYEEIDAIYTEEKKQLNELEERFKTLEAEYLQIMEERRLAREKREKAERELALMVKAATTVQAFWRSFKVRKALKSKKKKKGGGGKKKKK